MSNPGALAIDIYQGDTFTLSLDFDIDLTGHTWLCQIRKSHDATAVVQAVTVTTVDAVNGLIRLSIANTDTATLAPGSYLWDLQSTDASGVVRTWVRGTALVTAEVSR